MRLPENHEMVATFAPDGANQSFDMAVLPRRAGRSRPIANTHGTKPPLEDDAIYTVKIADQITRRLIPGERLGDLPRNLLCSRVRRDVRQRQWMSLKTQDNEPLQPDPWHDEQINRRDLGRVVAQEMPPSLR